MAEGPYGYQIDGGENGKPRFCFFRVLRLPQGDFAAARQIALWMLLEEGKVHL